MTTQRVVVTGPESTGKTTLAAALGAHFEAPWVPEAARRFVETVSSALSAETVEPIARLAMQLDDAASVQAPPLLVLDTDLVSTVVYARHYYGATPAWIASEARARRGDLYLLCLPDLPWEADGVRDRPAARGALLGDFRQALDAIGARVVEIAGTGTARTDATVRAVEALLSRG
jgi:NadR type nicotinamide-nucleotide adenylyltransferase